VAAPIARALGRTSRRNDIVVTKAAARRPRFNLMDSDIVNLRVARHADARCLLVSDIDRGGRLCASLRHLGADAPRPIARGWPGFVLNKFPRRCRAARAAPERLQEMTGVPTLATLPMWWQHGLPEEDGVFDERNTAAGDVRLTVAVVACPRISNLDEFQPLKNVAGLRLRWVRSPAELAGADWIVLPGSKHTSGDLAWLRAQGLDRAVAQHAARGGAVLGICGGLQMLGEALIDPHGVDGNGPGLGLLPLVTVFEQDKTVCLREARFGALTGPWAALSGVALHGYEIHHGQTAQHPAMAPARAVLARRPGWQNAQGNVLGLYLHGLFEDPAALQALFGAARRTLETVFDGLADFIDPFRAGVLRGLHRLSLTMHIEDHPRPRARRSAAAQARPQDQAARRAGPAGGAGAADGLILGSETPRLREPQLLVCAGDHGLAARGVSAYPSDVTWQMVENFLAGGAAVSVLARQHGLALTVVDCGVRHDFAPRKGLRIVKVAPGTADASSGPAMSAAQCEAAIGNGMALVRGLPGNAVLLGEMGIGIHRPPRCC
jgi:adenosylcobyric acid synthase